MENTLKDNGTTATVKQFGKKLIDLKNYYGVRNEWLKARNPVELEPMKYMQDLGSSTKVYNF